MTGILTVGVALAIAWGTVPVRLERYQFLTLDLSSLGFRFSLVSTLKSSFVHPFLHIFS